MGAGAQLVFVKGGSGERHRVWITPDGRGDAWGLDLHVRHDLPHLVVESLVGIDDGLWASLVADGAYPGLTDAHRVAKAVTNGVMGAARAGTPTVAGVAEALATYAGVGDISAYVDRLDDELIESAVEQVLSLFARWARTPVGEALRLEWPLASPELRDEA